VHKLLFFPVKLAIMSPFFAKTITYVQNRNIDLWSGLHESGLAVLTSQTKKILRDKFKNKITYGSRCDPAV
jgi:hypothetical protein